MKNTIILAVAFVASVISTTSFAQMNPTKDIVDNAVSSKDHTTLVAVVTAEGLVEN